MSFGPGRLCNSWRPQCSALARSTRGCRADHLAEWHVAFGSGGHHGADRVVLSLRRRDRHQGSAVQPFLIQGSIECGSRLADRSALPLPLGRAPPGHRFPEIQHQVVGGTERVALARRVFPEIVDFVRRGQV